MKNAALRLGSLGLWVFLMASSAVPAIRGWNFRLTGGRASLDGGDFSAGLIGRNDFIRGEYNLVGGSLRRPEAGFELLADVEVEIMPRFSLALGIGYLQARKSSAIEYDDWIIHAKEDIRPCLRAIPMTITASYRLPVWGRLSFRAAGGFAVYFANIRWEREYLFVTSWITDKGMESWHASAACLGLQGHIAIEYAIGPRLSVVLEGGGRWARFSGPRGPWTLKGSDTLSGDYADSGTRTLWRYDATPEGRSYPVWVLSDAEPHPVFSAGVEPARIDLSGWTLRAGLRLSL